MLRKFMLLLLLVPLGVSADTSEERVDAVFASWDREDSPGCALGVIEDGRYVYKRGYGMANLEYGIPISSSSVFRVGSVSKQFAAFTILLAEQQGKLDLDDDVRKYVPELPETDKKATIRHLIHHTSGIRDYLTLMELRGLRSEDFYTEADIIDALARQENTNFEPGTEYLYSNSGYFLLSEIVLRATGMSLRQFAARHMFEPLKMEHTHFHDDFREIVENRADGYAPVEDGGFEISMTTLNMVGDGGIYTTIDDLLAWDRNYYTGEVGGEELKAKRLVTGRLNDGTEQNYAAGLDISEYRGLLTVSHGGSFVGFRAGMLQFPEQRFSVYVLCNVSSAEPMSRAYEVADIYLEKRFSAPRPSEIETEVSLPVSELAKWTGTYFDETTGELAEMEMREGALFWREEERSLFPLGEAEFVGVDEESRVNVRFEGTVMRVKASGQREFRYERVRAVDPSVGALAQYIGLYRCAELEATYHVELGENQELYLESRSRSGAVEPVFEDGFRWSRDSIVFRRDDAGRIRGFELASGRARNFFFERL